MKHICRKAVFTLLCAGVLFTAGITPVFAYDNSSTDEIGAATTIYQMYKENGAEGELAIDTNVAGKSPDIENFIDNTLGLATRLVPFSYDAAIQYYADTAPTTFFVTFRSREYNDLNTAVQEKIAELAAEASALESDYEKLKFINDYLVDHCEYLSEAMKDPQMHETAFTAYGALIEGKAVCEGYTNAVQLFCEAADIPCMKVAGTVENGNHIWNAVYLEHKWWMLDTTFNDPIGVQDENDRLRFFLIDIDTFAQIGLHTYDSETFETCKMILMGRTTGQSTPLAVLNLSAQNAEAEDKPNASILRAEQQTTQANADALKSLGLFAGDEGGYRLNDAMTRIEMGVMVMRMNGGKEALTEAESYYQEACPFTDVPDWAKASIGFLYDNHLVAGQSETTFGTGAVTKQDYAVMMLRVLGADHTYDNALGIALQKGIVTEAQTKDDPIATRGDVVNMTYRTLQLLEATTETIELESDSTTESALEIDKTTNVITEASESPVSDENTSNSISVLQEDETNSEDTAEKEEGITDKHTMPL